MGRYDDISAARLRGDLVAFARLLLRLDREGALLESPAELQRLLGELRRKIFAFEVRAPRLPLGSAGARKPPSDASGPEFADSTEGSPEETRSRDSTEEPSAQGGSPPSPGRIDPADAIRRESRKVVREAMKREEEMIREWDGKSGNDEDDRE